MNIRPYNEVPERCVRITNDIAGNAEIRIEMTGEDMKMLPSHIKSTYDEETDTRAIIIPSEWAELIKKKLAYTAYGFEKDQLEYARELREAGITPNELKMYMAGTRKLLNRLGLCG